ncbi:MAG: aconitate hydratase, partial [Acutalibacteraceae bacterium]
TKSFARIHQANLINAGILPFTFANEADYDNIELGDELRLPEVRALITEGKPVVLEIVTKNECYPLVYSFSQRQTDMLLAGGLLNYTRENAH